LERSGEVEGIVGGKIPVTRKVKGLKKVKESSKNHKKACRKWATPRFIVEADDLVK